MPAISLKIATLLSRVRRVRRRFGEDASGATALEFAIVVVPFFGFVLLILQVGLFHFGLQSLDFAVRQAGRTVMTGQVASTAISAATFKTTYICPKVFFVMDCSKLVVNSFRLGKSSDASAATGVYAYINSTARQLNDPISDPAKQSFCLGGPGDYIYLDASYPYPNYVRRLLSATAGQSWMLRSSTVVYNEPKAKNPGASC